MTSRQLFSSDPVMVEAKEEKYHPDYGGEQPVGDEPKAGLVKLRIVKPLNANMIRDAEYLLMHRGGQEYLDKT